MNRFGERVHAQNFGYASQAVKASPSIHAGKAIALALQEQALTGAD